MTPLRDSFGRVVDYLRLSVTDRCNLRCVYCLPANGGRFVPSEDLLTDDEIVRLSSVALRVGISKLRVTGGEPLARPGVVELIRRLAALPGLQDLSLSTNGVRLAEMATDLRAAGLRRVNISLDTQKPDRFARVTRWGSFHDVWAGVEAATTAGFDPVKINVVVMKGVNDDEIPEFVALTRDRPLHVRFIELMPIGETGFFGPDRWLPLNDIRARCGPLEPLPADDAPRGFGPAVYHRAPGGRGTVGFISALSCNFCARCNRLRLTSRGRLAPCLASDDGFDLRSLLRTGADDATLARTFVSAAMSKPERHAMDVHSVRVRESFMCGLGG